MTRQVTENDFRMPQFIDEKVEDYEFRADGKLVRKDRWETGIRRIASILDNISSREFEIDELIREVKILQESKKIREQPDATNSYPR